MAISSSQTIYWHQANGVVVARKSVNVLTTFHVIFLSVVSNCKIMNSSPLEKVKCSSLAKVVQSEISPGSVPLPTVVNFFLFLIHNKTLLLAELLLQVDITKCIFIKALRPPDRIYCKYDNKILKFCRKKLIIVTLKYNPYFFCYYYFFFITSITTLWISNLNRFTHCCTKVNHLFILLEIPV